MLSDLMNQPIIVESQVLARETDKYGTSIPAVTLTEVDGYLHQQNRSEAEGWVPIGTWQLFLPFGTTIQADDKVHVANESYVVEGPPTSVWNPHRRVYSHIEATLKRTAGGLEGED